MLYHLLVPLSEQHQVFNLFRYISFRAAWGMVTALVVCFALYPPFIRWMRGLRVSQVIRDDGPERHLETKQGTPTMGGLPMLGAIVLSTLLWARLDQPVVWAALAVLLGYGALGFADDWRKVTEHSSRGVPGRVKLLVQFGWGAAVAWWIGSRPEFDAELWVPFVKHPIVGFEGPQAAGALLLAWVALASFVLAGASNAVNLTDGLDGLAIGPVMTAAGTFGILAYLAGHAVLADYLGIPHVAGAGELTVFAVAMLGAGLGFLWYNTFPAQIFMGDVGSLALGGALGALAVLTKNELLLVLVGGIFVLEALSVIVQVASFRLFGRRVFAMAPIHHHFEKRGWSEPKIIVRFWIISILLALVALSTIKVR